MPRLLIVDDEAQARRTFARILGAYFVVESTADVETALALLYAGEEQRIALFDAILCDLNLPGMSGRDLHAELARQGHELAARIVFITAAETAEDDPFATAMAGRYLVKPCSTSEITTALRRVAFPRVSVPCASA